MSIIAAAMMPIFTLERVEGRIFRPVALTYAFALGGALFFTLTAVPALTTVLLKNRKVEGDGAGVPHLAARALPDRAARRAQVPDHRRRSSGSRSSRCAVSLIPKLGTEFLPEMNEGDIHVTVTMPSAVSLERGAEVLRETRLTLLTFPEVKDVLTEQGHPEDGTDDEAPNQAETFVIMKPESEWHTGRKKEQIVDAMRAELEKRPGVDYNFSQPIKDRVEESISGIRGQIVVKIYGEDLHLMHEKLEQVKQHPRTQRAARATSRSIAPARRSTWSPTSIARRPRATASRCATSRTRSRAASAASCRRAVGGRAQGRRAREAADADEGDADSLARLDVPTGTGNARMPLAPLANVHVDRGRTQINREQGGRFLALKCNIEGRDMGTFVDEAQDAGAARRSSCPRATT